MADSAVSGDCGTIRRLCGWSPFDPVISTPFGNFESVADIIMIKSKSHMTQMVPRDALHHLQLQIVP